MREAGPGGLTGLPTASLETLPKVLVSPWSCWSNPHLMKSPNFHPQQEGSGVLRLFVYFC